MTPLSEIERDLDWRESELAVLKILLADTSRSDREKLVLFRAAWALLYAHYEGFCKFALTVYYDAIKSSGRNNRDLPVKMRCFSLEKDIRLVKNLPSEQFLERVTAFEIDFMAKSPDFPEVDTASNLWPNILKELLDCASIEVVSLSHHNVKLRTLVNRRNKIAHGERDIIPEYDYYAAFDDAVTTIMYDLAVSIQNKLDNFDID
jgi:hypothetical protein